MERETMNIVWITVSVLAWGAVHSWLASEPVKGAAHRLIGGAADRIYRLAFNVFAGVSLLPVLLLARLLPDHALYAVPAPWLFLMLAGQVAAIVCLTVALLQTDALHFLGLRQLVQRESGSVLNTQGFYGWVRHPLYLFGLVILWLTPVMTVNVLTLFALLSAYLFVGAKMEERRLVREFGDEYEEYRRRTPMMIPWLMLGRARKVQTESQPDEAGR
jgi:protein-S-isoprenylcysteine O-methyltransferase Ste14